MENPRPRKTVRVLATGKHTGASLRVRRWGWQQDNWAQEEKASTDSESSAPGVDAREGRWQPGEAGYTSSTRDQKEFWKDWEVTAKIVTYKLKPKVVS